MADTRLFMLVPSVTSAFGEQVEVLVAHLRDSGIRVFLAVPTHYHDLRPRHPDDWVFETKGSKGVTLSRLLSPTMLWSLLRHLLSVRPDCVYIYCGEAYPPSVLLLFACWLLEIKCVLSIHDAAPHPGKMVDWAYEKLRLWFLYLPNVLHTFSQHGCDALRRRYPRKEIVESPLLDLTELYFRYPVVESGNEKAILCFGRIEPYKDIPCVVAAFKQLLKDCPDATLRIVGKNGLGSHLFSITRDVPNCKVVEEFQPPRALAAELSRAHACIFAYSEASHTGGAELALGFGCNVVATTVAAFRGLAGRAGVFLFEPGDAFACARSLRGALEVPKRSRDPGALRHIQELNRDRALRFVDRALFAPHVPQ